MFKIYVATKKSFFYLFKLWIFLLAISIGKVGFCQANNPTAFDLSVSDFTFSTQIASNTIYPASIQGWMTGTNNLAAPAPTTAAPLSDEPLIANGTATTSGLSNLGANGFNFLSTGTAPNQQVGVIALSLNTTNRNSILVTWTAADQTNDPSSREMNLTLQYRIGTIGVFAAVSGSTYTTSNFNQKAAATFLNVLLPSICDNKAVVQLRWIYYESAAQSNNRDAVRLDDVSVTSTANSIVSFDNFNRVNSATVGIPSSEVSTTWTETESGTNRASIDGNQLRLSTSNTPSVGGNNNTAREMISFDMSSKYSTTFNSSSNDLTWYFNMKQSRATPSGFSTTTYGAAFVLGCNNADYTNASASGYAVIIGNTGTPDNVKLIYFTGGLVGTYANGGVNEIAVSAESGATPAYSVKVSFNPCTNLWSFQVRNDGASFADPTVGSLGTVYTGTNSTNVNLDLRYMGALWNHQGPVSGSDDAYFDNISIPSGISSINTYVWNGATTDYQVASNWTPDRNCPKVNDVLVFDATSPATSTVTSVPTQTIGRLLVSGNRTVSFKDNIADALPNTITIGGGTGDDFVVQSGSTFNFDIASNTGTNSMVVSLLTGATGDISGVVDFVNTFNATSRTHQLLAADANAIIVKSGGVVRATKLTGNPFDNFGAANVLIFQSGAIYESLDGGNPFGLGQPASKVVFQTGSLYRHSQTTQPSFSGRTYADFEFNLVGTSSVTGGSFSGVMTADNIKILNGTLNVTGALSLAPVNMNVKGDLTVAAGATFNYSPGAAAYASTIAFTSTNTIQKINSAGTITFGRFATLELNNTHSTPRLDIETNITIQGTLKITSGNLNLSTGDITIQSDATSTANVSAVNGTVTYGTGLFSIERYLFGKRAWRLLATPIEQVSSPSIFNSWQEAGSLVSTGYGTQLSGPTGGTGLDFTTVRGSLKWYDTTAQTYIEITNTNNAIARTEGYYVFVRGDRAQGLSGTGLATNLRIKGKILTGTQPDINLGALHFASVGNPYPSAIDFRNVFKANMVDAFIAWNPNSAGSYNLGAFETYVYNVGAGHYLRTPGGQIRDSIQSGEAVFVQTFTGGGILRFDENDKVGGSRNVSRGANALSRDGVTEPTLDIDLYTKDVNGSIFLADGVKINFGNGYSNALDNNDVKKISNTADNLSITNKAIRLVVERRHTLQSTDTIFLNLTSTRIAAYRFEIDPSVLTNTGLDAFLKDKFLQTETPVSLSAVTNVDFDITADAASRAADRFMIVFKQAASVHFTTISALRNADKTVQIKWGTQQEVGVINYEVQHSNDGINFTSVYTQLPLANNGTNPSYSKQDATATKNNNWYRVKATMVNGSTGYTGIAMVGALLDVAIEPSITIYPNPVEDKMIKMHFAGHAGKYAMSLLNAAGKTVYSKNIVVVSDNETQTIEINKSFAAGNYSVVLVAEDGTKKILKLVIL
jgi:hypothetical protein